MPHSRSPALVPEMLGDHHMYRKTFPYESSARIPFLVRAPPAWNLPAETVCKSPVGLQDVMPTILSAAGLPIPPGCTGRDLMPVVRGEADGVRDVLHGEHAGCYADEDGMHFLVDEDQMKYIWYSTTGVERLFDLAADPTEQRDLAFEARSRPSELEEMLAPWRARLAQILDGRPEGWAEAAAAGAGAGVLRTAEHKTMLPGYDPALPFAEFL